MSVAGRRWALRGGALVLAAAVVGVGLETIGRRAPEAVSFAVDLRSGASQSPTFHAAYDAVYEVGLEVDRTLPFERTNCLLGARTFSGPDPVRPAYCAQIPSLVNLDWTVYEGAQVVARGASRPDQYAAYGETITRNLGVAPLRPGRDYRIEVRSRQDASALAPASPRIVVAVHPSVWKDEWVWRSLGVVAALAVGVAGGLMMVVGGIVWGIGRRRGAERTA